MKNYLLLLLLILSLAIISFTGCGGGSDPYIQNPFSSTPTPTGGFTVSGTITNASFSQLSNASLTITSPNGYFNTTNTNQQGQFFLNNLQGGDYLIRVTLNGYITLNNYITVPANQNGSSSFVWSLWTINDWNSAYPDHQYDSQTGYIKVSIIDINQNRISGASVACNPNSYVDLGYMVNFNNPPSIDWNGSSTTAVGDAMFYRVVQGNSIYTLSAVKLGFTFNQAINCSSNPGEISTVIITQQ